MLFVCIYGFCILISVLYHNDEQSVLLYYILLFSNISFSLAASEFEAKLSPCAPPKIALVINNHLRKHIQDLYTKSNKVDYIHA